MFRYAIPMSNHENPTLPTDDAPAEGDIVTLAGSPGVEWTVIRAFGNGATIRNNATGGEGQCLATFLTVIRAYEPPAGDPDAEAYFRGE